MDHLPLYILSFVVIMAWLLVGYLIYTLSKSHKSKPRPTRVIGKITSVVETEEGLSVIGQLSEEGTKLFREDKLGYFSVGFQNMQGFLDTDDNGIKTIKEAHLSHISLDAEPGPYGRVVDYVGTQPKQEEKTRPPVAPGFYRQEFDNGAFVDIDLDRKLHKPNPNLEE